MPSRKIATMLACLLHRGTSIISQVYTGHIALYAFLRKIKAAESALCLRCETPETISHFFFYCAKYRAQRRLLRVKVGIASTSLARLITNAKCLPHTLKFVADTKQFKHYADVAPRPAP